MSLINQMLQDLEQRNASTGKTEPMSGEVRAVSAPTKSMRPVMLIGVALVVSIASAAAWIYLSETPKPVVSVAVTAPPASAKPVAAQQPVAPAEPAAATTPEVQPSAASTPVPAVQAETSAQPALPVRRMPGLDTSLAVVPAAPATQPASKIPAEKTSRPAPVPEPLAAGAVTADAAAKPMVTEPMPVKQKPVPKAVPGNAGASLKTVNPAQQSDNLYRQAVTILQQGRVAEAQDALRKALESDPHNLKARQALVGLLVEGKHNDEAMALLQEGLKLAPEQSGFSMALARLQVEAGDAKSGSDTLERGLQYAGEDADYHAFYAALLQREERHDAAVAHYLTALKSNPAMPSWLVGIGISLQAQGGLADASEAYQRARDTGQLTPQLLQFVEQRLKQVRQPR